ncbi:LPS assembly lipoprotein LptE [Candidatus Erwinia haradaeae]|uniref:LPS-assembly lipoprotein LptE n=1 Tax=Candidatus Erwinia haradaeae TaxID=1922217 RepID=A0A451D9T6_9GAMM|nr:LPS assembly lipoprotein LptE [Candidatus Erwinia haradaeae]VFP83062.1 LPS-assembly lipoprotein LptE [Candidatus Erwinia haradaeae]
MRKLLLSLLFYFLILNLSGCGYHTYPICNIPQILQTLIIDTTDPYGPLATAVYEELRFHNVNIIDTSTNNKNIASLHLQAETLNRDTIATFPNGKASEYLIMMNIYAEVIIPNKGIYPITSRVSRSFFYHPNAALANDTEQNIIIHDMRKQAIENLIRQLTTLDIVEKNRLI